MNKDEELEALIKEQRSEMKLGNYQPQERFVAFSLDKLNHRSSEESLENWDAFVTTFDEITGSLRVPVGHSAGMCAIHGNKAITVKKGDTGWYCRICEKERNRLRRRRYGAKPRGQCIHGDEFRVMRSDGARRCMECSRRANRDYYARQRAKARTTGTRS